MTPAESALAAGELRPVPRYGRVDVNAYIACVIRSAVQRIGGFEWTTMGIVSAESGFNPNAVGDAGCSIGLLQLNTCGGQGSDYASNPDALKDPVLNMEVGQPYIARAVLYATQQGWTGERFIREVARRSGHPGFVPLDDSRLTAIYNATIRLITDSNGNLVPWPPFNPNDCATPPPAPPPPLGSWTEGPAPTTRDQAVAAITRHLERMIQLLKAF